MISISELNALKEFVRTQQENAVDNRPMYLITEGSEITWKNASDVFDLEILSVGSKVPIDSPFYKAATEKRTVTEKVPRSVYGIRLYAISIPIVNESGNAVGAFSTVYPKLHPVAAAFDKFAPILAEMFPEGIFLYMTDLTKTSYKQSSKKFNIPEIRIGDALQEGDLALKTIKTKQASLAEFDAGKYGIPVLSVVYPLFDEDDETEVVATFGMILPKKIAVQLRDMSENLGNGLTGISAAIEELAASATQIHENEQELNKDIKAIITLSDEINKISVFIKEIADETKMLGLNAAIEAARAGDAGRGFGVVAEEIRKLSEQSKSTVPQIGELTDNIKRSVENVIEKSNSSLQSSQEQAAASEEITASVEEISSMAEELAVIAKQL